MAGFDEKGYVLVSPSSQATAGDLFRETTSVQFAAAGLMLLRGAVQKIGKDRGPAAKRLSRELVDYVVRGTGSSEDIERDLGEA